MSLFDKHDFKKTNLFKEYKGLISSPEYKNILTRAKNIYGLTERENKELKNEVGRLKDDLETLALENKLSTEDNEIYKALISAQEVEKLSLEDQNIELRNQLSKLKDIKIKRAYNITLRIYLIILKCSFLTV